MTVTVESFGSFEGKRVDQFKLTSETGVEVDIISWGVVVRDWRVPVAGGKRSVVLGYDNFESYPVASPYFGSLAGRVANRIKGASFTLDGRTHALSANFHGHTLHGGSAGLGREVWTGEADSGRNAVRFTLDSPDGDMGFPGNAGAPEVQAVIDRTLGEIMAAGKSAGILTFDPASAQRYAQMGVTFLGVGGDVAILVKAATALAQAVKAG